MKKAKVLLTAICLIGIVGGVLAFKAHKRLGPLWCTDIATSGTCTKRFTPDPTGTDKFCTTTSTGHCDLLVKVVPNP
jgi:hypothetical protein